MELLIIIFMLVFDGGSYCYICLHWRLQILCTYDSISEIDVEAVSKFVASLQQPEGGFFGDQWGEVDTRFSFCAVAILSILVSYQTLRLKWE